MKDLERDQDRVGTAGAAFASAEAKVRRNTSEIDGVRERSKGDGTDWKDAIDRVEAAERRERDWRAEENFDFDWRMEYLGVKGDKRVRLVTSNLDRGIIIYESGHCS